MRHRNNTEGSLPAWLEKNLPALRAFDVLASKCDPDGLLEALTVVRLDYEVYHRKPSTKARPVDIDFDHFELPDPDIPILENTFEDRIGFDRKSLKTVIARMRTCAQDLKRLRVSVLIRELSLAAEEDGAKRRVRKVLSRHSTLPFRPDQIAAAAEFAARTLSFRGRPLYDQALASLVRYVHESSGRWHDEQVSILVGAATGSKYSVDNHRRWRMTHRELCGM